MKKVKTEIDQLIEANKLVALYLNEYTIEERIKYCDDYVRAKAFLELKKKQYATKNVYAIIDLIR